MIVHEHDPRRYNSEIDFTHGLCGKEVRLADPKHYFGMPSQVNCPECLKELLRMTSYIVEHEPIDCNFGCKDHDKNAKKHVPTDFYVVLSSGAIEQIFDLTEEQAAYFVDMYPQTHIFMKENAA